MKVKHDFTEVVNTFIAHGEDGVNRKKEMEELIGGFLQTVQESISKHFTKSFTCSSEPAPQSVDDHSFFGIVKGGARSENKFEVYIIIKIYIFIIQKNLLQTLPPLRH